MTDIAVFPAYNPADGGHLGLVRTFTATTAWTAGQVLCFAATGVANALIPCINGAGTIPVGVALYDTAASAKGAVAMIGSVVKVVFSQASASLEAGDYVYGDDNAVAGTISAVAPAALSSTYSLLGILLEGITGASTGGKGFMLITGPSVATGGLT